MSTWACHQWATTSARPRCSIRDDFCRRSVAPSRARRRWYRTAPSETPRIRAVWDCDWPRCCKTSIVTICSLVSLAKVLPPSGPLDVQGQLESAWLTCRWMFSTTAVLNPCQARNDSGSLTPSFTGLVTLLKASGYASHPSKFVELIHILDSELRLITPIASEDSTGEHHPTAPQD